MEATTKPTGADAREELLAGIPIPERAIELAGVSTTILEGGTGKPVILLHGPGAFSGHWAQVISGLVETHRVIAPDLPGHGSSVVAGVPDAERVLDWLGELIDRTCPQPPVVVGHGLGAIAARFAARNGRAIEHLVLVDTLGLTEFSPAPEFGQALEEFMHEPSERTHDALWSYCALDLDGVRARMGESWDVFRAYNVDRAQDASASAAVGALMEEFGLPAMAPEVLERIDAPTSLIWGRADLAAPLALAEEASERYGWPLHVIEECADDPPVERPEEFVEALRACLEEGSAR